MCSEARFMVLLLFVMAVSCSPYMKMKQVRSGDVNMSLSVPEDDDMEEEPAGDIVIDSMRTSLAGEPFIMNAIKDAETGEMVATDVISASRVTARFRNVAERTGYVSISFDVTVPSQLSSSGWRLKILPRMTMHDDTLCLDPVFITGQAYREGQLRGYERYRRFLESIISDTADFLRVRQLEIFIERHFPETYAMKTDSSIVPEPMAANYFGVTQKDALEHYTRQLKKKRNDRRKSREGIMYDRYVKDPIVREGIRLDTVLTSYEGDFIYRYVHTFRSRPGLKKVTVSLDGRLYERGECIFSLPFSDSLVFYISTLAALTDETPRYRMIVLERKAYDNTKALIDFEQGRSVIDTTLGDNASELLRIRKCIDDVASFKEYVLDSLVIIASCSPEGPYVLNEQLSAERSEAVKEYLESFVPEEWRDSLKVSVLPENWEQLEKLVANDTVMSKTAVRRVLEVIGSMGDPDVAEMKLARFPEYLYMRENLYPKLRSVRFDFHLHRKGMVKDTVHTTELDAVYMAGVKAMKELDYKKAVTILRPYDDYNAALAFMSADYDHSALDVLNRLDDTDPKVCYLKAMVLSRLGVMDEAVKYYELAIAYDPYLEHRANLDPEMFRIVQKYKSNRNDHEN